MEYISVKEASFKFGISERRVQKLCEEKRITGAQMISNVWIIPITADKPTDERLIPQSIDSNALSLNDLCSYLSISTATGRNWIKLGKITPTEYHKNRPFFSRKYCDELKSSIQSGKNSALKSRRNKKYVSGSYLYQDYVADNSKNLQVTQNLLNEIDTSSIELSEDFLRALLCECALQLFNQKYYLGISNSSHLLEVYLNNRTLRNKFTPLIDDLIRGYDYSTLKTYSKSKCFDFEYTYEDNEDILGLLYISCKNISNRKATGAYYTPTKVVKELIRSLSETDMFDSKSKVLDPCSGTGNFLLQLPHKEVNNIFGVDIDEISVKLTRINMALKYSNCEIETLYNNFVIADYFYYSKTGYDCIIGNPPWGFDYSDEEKNILTESFSSAKGKSIESYNLFIEQSLKKLTNNGILSFILPEAILNVKIHKPIRDIILKGNSIQYIDYLGNVFDKVQCPCIILQLCNTGQEFNTIGLKIKTKDSSFCINTNRKVSSEYFSFTITDEEYTVLQKIISSPDCIFLKNNATFALGLVTGNNQKYVAREQGLGYEAVLKGADICKYTKKHTENYLLFKPEEFQQVAPIEYYRAPEKLLYRFICRQLVFAYDNQQTLSLNSCNILIPTIESLNIKYILAVLNSRIAQFVFSKRFQSVKVLRSHIESIPIPMISKEQQQEIILLVDKILSINNESDKEELYDIIDKNISRLFDLSDDEYSTIKKSQIGENIFLS